LAALVFVVGTLLSLLSADDSETPDPTPARPALPALVDASQLVVEGEAEIVERIGDPSDAGVIATIDVERVVGPSAAVLDEVVVFDMGFREGWSEGQRSLLFLSVEGALPGDAEYRVSERCILDGEGFPCPYDIDEVERLFE
jgi:hypothetical protein